MTSSFDAITSSFEELSKTSELISDPIGQKVLGMRMASDVAGTGFDPVPEGFNVELRRIQ